MDTWLIGRETPESVVEHLAGIAGSGGRPPIICIDYFDTLATRTIIPEHTKIIASTVLGRLLGDTLPGSELYGLRQALELEMTNANAEETGELDFCLRDFAGRFWSLLQEKKVSIPFGTKEEFVDTLLHLETAVEKSVQVLCPEMLQVVEGLRRHGFDLVLVSDFYLPEEFFIDILEFFGIRQLFSRIYVSSTHGRSKGAGTIYPKIAADCGCPASCLLMIGDNMHADIDMARKAGLQTFFVQQSPQDSTAVGNRGSWRTNDTGQLADFAATGVSGPFGEMAFSLWLFIHRLFNELWQGGVRNVFFLSKEGEFLRKLFMLYQDVLFGRELIRSHYLIVSRKSTFLPSLRKLPEEDFSRLLCHYRDLSITEFLRSLNLGRQLVEDICRQLPIDCQVRLQELRLSQEFRTLLSLPLFREEYERKRQEQRANFMHYFNSFEIPYKECGVYLVDVGWKGSIQDNIFHLFDRSVAVHGYYIGSLNATEHEEKNTKKGVLFDDSGQSSPFLNVYNSNRSLFEMMLGATHGSADCYLTETESERLDRINDHLLPQAVIRYDAGAVQVMVRDLPEERSLFDTHIRPLQIEMQAVCMRLCRAFLRENCCIPGDEWFARRHARMVFRPRKEEIDFFQNLYHLENFGIFEFTHFSATRQPIVQRVKNLMAILRHPEVLDSGIWPPVILRRLGLGPLCRLDGMRRYLKAFLLKREH